jgi:homoserine kinase
MGTADLRAGARVVLEVPATSANLGPGFDCFGLALNWRDRVTVEVSEHGFAALVTGEGADAVPTDARHLIVASALTGLADLGVEVPGLRVRSHNTIPHGRGLGSSSAAIVAGLAGAWGLAGLAGAWGLARPGDSSRSPQLDRHWLLGHANAIEGHPDNVAAAVYGGFVLAYGRQDRLEVASVPLDARIAAVAWVPSESVPTRAARGLLPLTVPHADAAADAGRAALLVHAMSADPDLLFPGTEDWLHQAYRRSAMPSSFDLVGRLRADGYAAVISGAGPTVLVLLRVDQVSDLLSRTEPGFTARELRPAGGVTVIEQAGPAGGPSTEADGTGRPGLADRPG